MGSTGGEDRVSNTFPSSSSLVLSPLRFSLVSREPGEIPGPSGGGQSIAAETGNRRDHRRLPGVLQQAVPGFEGLGEVETSFGCVSVEQLCGQDQVFHGDQPVSPRLHSEGRLDGLHGHERCLLPYPNSRQFQEVLEVPVRLENLPISSTVFRAHHCPTSLHQSPGPSGEDSSPCRIPDHPVPGRLASHSEIKGRSAEGEGFHFESSKGSRDPNQRRKVLFGSDTGYRLPGHEHRLLSFLGFPSEETNRFRSVNSQRVSRLRRAASKVLAVSARTFIFSRKVRDRVSSQDEASAISSKSNLGQSFSEGFHPSTTRLKEVPSVVVRTREDIQRAVSSKEEPRPEVVFRRLQGRLGSDHRRGSSLRKVVSFGQEITHQYTRTESDLVGPETSPSTDSEQNSGSIWGQHHSLVLHQETGRDEIVGSFPSGGRNLSVAGTVASHPDSTIYTELQEYGSRLPEQEGPGPAHGVDSTPGCMQRNLEMVGSADGGLVRHKLDKEASSLHVPPLRPDGHSDGRHVARLVQYGSLCFPSLRYGQESDKQIQREHQLQAYIDRPLVATEGVVSRSSEAGSRTAKTSSTQTGSPIPTSSKGQAQKPPHASSSRMETMLRLTKHREFSKLVSKSIYESRKPSTNVLYQKRWSTFVNWCRLRKLSASRPSINSLCEFFIYLFEEKGLVVDTIRCYRSTLHSVLRHTGLKINKNQDIADVIRSLKLRAPVSNPRLVNWNLDVVLKYLCSEKFEPLTQCSLLSLTKKTFILLALALSKRVSELQALSRSVGFCTEGALVSLCLDFRAKNDTKCKDLDRHFLIKELGSLVGQEEEALLCPVRSLSAYLERTKPLVGRNMSRLFVSPRKPTNPASKNALTSLAKQVIREAHENLRPDLLPVLKVKTHELRGVSTTLAFKKNLSLKSVMEAAQWRCHSVFASHYLKEIAFNYDDCRTLGPLLMAGTVIT